MVRDEQEILEIIIVNMGYLSVSQILDSLDEPQCGKLALKRHMNTMSFKSPYHG